MPAPAAPARRVQVAVGEALGGQHVADDDDGGAGDARGVHPLGERRRGCTSAPSPAASCANATTAQGVSGRIAAGEQLGHDRVDLRGGQVQHQRGARRPTASRRSSPGGIAVDSVATRVSVTVCATPGTVSSRPSAAAAAAKAGTPGTIS